MEQVLQNQLKSVRTRLGLSQQELATAAGVTRQTIGGIEASLYSPSAMVAMRISRALGCPVEDVFWLDETQAETVRAHPALTSSDQESAGERVLLARVGDRWVSHRLRGESAFRSDMIPADGTVLEVAEADSVQTVRLLDSPETLARTILVAGCDPNLSLWAQSAERWHPGLRVGWIHHNSTQSLLALARDEIHIAGLHVHHAESGEDNLPLVRQILGETSKEEISLVNLGAWDEGLLMASGNPLGIQYFQDVTRVRFINREQGAGARALFDSFLKSAQIDPATISGYEVQAASHLEVARALDSGQADAGMGTRAIAQAFGLSFLALRRVRYDLAMRTSTLQWEPVRQLLGTLQHRWVRSQLQLMSGYDLTQSGQVIATIAFS